MTTTMIKTKEMRTAYDAKAMKKYAKTEIAVSNKFLISYESLSIF